jgi:hypothetical protein
MQSSQKKEDVEKKLYCNLKVLDMEFGKLTSNFTGNFKMMKLGKV